MEELNIFTKLSFLESIKNSSVSTDILKYLCKRYSKSFVQDVKLLESHFQTEISVIFDGILDSIYSCLNKYKSNTYKKNA